MIQNLPSAGLNRIRFNGFASASQPQGHPEVSATLSPPERRCKGWRRALESGYDSVTTGAFRAGGAEKHPLNLNQIMLAEEVAVAP